MANITAVITDHGYRMIAVAAKSPGHLPSIWAAGFFGALMEGMLGIRNHN